MTYLDWLDKHHLHKWEISPRTAFDAGYEEGQEAGRERIKAIIQDMPEATSPSFAWVCDKIMEKIDAPTI